MYDDAVLIATQATIQIGTTFSLLFELNTSEITEHAVARPSMDTIPPVTACTSPKRKKHR